MRKGYLSCPNKAYWEKRSCKNLNSMKLVFMENQAGLSLALESIE